MVQHRKRKGKQKGKGQHHKGKGHTGYATTTTATTTRVEKEISRPIGWERKSIQRTTWIWQRKRMQHKGKGKGYHNDRHGGGKHVANLCYRRGRPGHMAKHRKVAIYNFDTNDQTDRWNHAHYDGNWHHQGQTQVQQLSTCKFVRSTLQEAAVAMIDWHGTTTGGRQQMGQPYE